MRQQTLCILQILTCSKIACAKKLYHKVRIWSNTFWWLVLVFIAKSFIQWILQCSRVTVFKKKHRAVGRLKPAVYCVSDPDKSSVSTIVTLHFPGQLNQYQYHSWWRARSCLWAMMMLMFSSMLDLNKLWHNSFDKRYIMPLSLVLHPWDSKYQRLCQLWNWNLKPTSDERYIMMLIWWWVIFNICNFYTISSFVCFLRIFCGCCTLSK